MDFIISQAGRQSVYRASSFNYSEARARCRPQPVAQLMLTAGAWRRATTNMLH